MSKSPFSSCDNYEFNKTESLNALNETERVERLRCYFIKKNDYEYDTRYLMNNIILNKTSELGDHYERGLDCIQHGLETSQPG